jgi:hypothetical protein
VFKSKNMSVSLPVYTTRPYGSTGETATYRQSLWLTAYSMLLISLNAIAWGILGLVYAVLTAYHLIF